MEEEAAVVRVRVLWLQEGWPASGYEQVLVVWSTRYHERTRISL